MPTRRQKFGSEAERQAADFLLAKGFRLIERHVTSRYGEIDVLMFDGDTVVAVEVKARRSKKFGRAIESITEKKIIRLMSALHEYVMTHHLEQHPHRIDVVTIEPSGLNHLSSVGSLLS